MVNPLNINKNIKVDKVEAAMGIHMAMVLNGYSQRRLARETGINQTFISAFLTGKIDLHKRDIEKLLATIGLNWKVE